jgi:hypothetical protein
MSTASYYAKADIVLDGLIALVRERDGLTTPEVADALVEALGHLAREMPLPDTQDRRERLLAAVLATALQRLIHTGEDEP